MLRHGKAEWGMGASDEERWGGDIVEWTEGGGLCGLLQCSPSKEAVEQATSRIVRGAIGLSTLLPTADAASCSACFCRPAPLPSRKGRIAPHIQLSSFSLGPGLLSNHNERHQ